MRTACATMTFRIPTELADFVEATARKNHMTMSAYLRDLIQAEQDKATGKVKK